MEVEPEFPPALRTVARSRAIATAAGQGARGAGVGLAGGVERPRAVSPALVPLEVATGAAGGADFGGQAGRAALPADAALPARLVTVEPLRATHVAGLGSQV